MTQAAPLAQIRHTLDACGAVPTPASGIVTGVWPSERAAPLS